MSDQRSSRSAAAEPVMAAPLMRESPAARWSRLVRSRARCSGVKRAVFNPEPALGPATSILAPLRYEPQRGRVHAVAQIGGRWAVIEDVPQMGIALTAQHLGPFHG